MLVIQVIKHPWAMLLSELQQVQVMLRPGGIGLVWLVLHSE